MTFWVIFSFVKIINTKHFCSEAMSYFAFCCCKHHNQNQFGRKEFILLSCHCLPLSLREVKAGAQARTEVGIAEMAAFWFVLHSWLLSVSYIIQNQPSGGTSDCKPYLPTSITKENVPPPPTHTLTHETIQ